MKIELTRSYGFPAAHILRHARFSEAENLRVYGKCANPSGHGHDYGIEVTVSGPLDERSGRIVAPEQLDALVEDHVVQRFGHKLLNEDPLFERCVPTAENVARVVHGILEAPLAQVYGLQLVRVRVIETPRNSFEYGAS